MGRVWERTMSSEWQATVPGAMAGIVEPDLWARDADGDMRVEESDGEPGWLVWCSGMRLRLDHGSITFESDVHGDLARAARALLAASAAWDVAS